MAGQRPTFPLKGLTVLLVEDESLIAFDVESLLREAGVARTLLASSLAKAQEILAEEPAIDMCILDIKLGQEDASPFAALLRQRGIPFVIATGYASAPVGGAHEVIRKPYNGNELITAIQHATGSCRGP